MSAPTTTTTLTVRVRFFAAAAEAAGTAAEDLVLAGGATLEDLRTELTARYPGAAHVLGISSFLVNDVVRSDPGTQLDPTTAGTVRVDVLPPFAGG